MSLQNRYWCEAVTALNFRGNAVTTFGMANTANVNCGSNVTFQPELNLVSGAKQTENAW